jgi:hypothetical protein
MQTVANLSATMGNPHLAWAAEIADLRRQLDMLPDEPEGARERLWREVDRRERLIARTPAGSLEAVAIQVGTVLTSTNNGEGELKDTDVAALRNAVATLSRLARS